MTHRVLAVCVLVALGGAARAELTCSQAEYDAGRVRGGVALTHRFTLVNTGREQIEIGEPKSGCGCLRPAVDRRRVAPGESATVTVEAQTVTQAAGNNVWRVLVPYRELGQQGEVLLQVKAHVVPEVSIQPATLVIHTTSALSHALTMIERRGEPLTIRSTQTTSPHVKARASEATKDSGMWLRMIALEVAPNCPVGRHEHVLHVHTDDPNYPELKIPFTVVKRSPEAVIASPAEVEWRGNGEGLPSRIVLLTAAEEKPVDIERVETSHPSLRCTYAQGPGSRATLRITCEPRPTGGLDGEVKVYLRGPSAGVLTIPARLRP